MPPKVSIQNLNNPDAKTIKATYCNDFFSRLIGFTFRRKLDEDEGLILVDTTSIHMFFVWTELAVIWVNSKTIVVDKVLAKPWFPFYAPKKPARYVLEAHPDRLIEYNIGDQVIINYE